MTFGEGVGGRIVETGPGGEEGHWGTVTAWDPPRRVAFTWHPGRDVSDLQEVMVTFEPAGEGTRVTLVHAGWEALAEVVGPKAHEERAGYDAGWEGVLGEFTGSF